MKRFFLSLCIIAALHTQAQVTTYYDWQWKKCDLSLARFVSVVKRTDSGWLRNDIYLATKKLQMEGLYKDSSCQTPHGWIRRYYINRNLLSETRYTNGKLDGPLITYHYNGMMHDSMVYVNGVATGTLMSWHSNGYIADSVVYSDDGSAVQVSWFDNGMPSSAGKTKQMLQEGKWRYFHRNGNSAALEEYKEGKLLSRIYYDENGTPLADTSNKDREAEFKGGVKKWREYLLRNLQFPANTKLVNTDIITVVVNATVDEEGKISDLYVSIPFNTKFDDEALLVMKRSPKWLPAIRQNRRVKSYIRQPISFRQE